MRGQQGYTLLELLVVLAVMGLIAAAIPEIALPGIAGIKLEGKVAEVNYQLKRAREQAIETGKMVIVTSEELKKMGATIINLNGNSSQIQYFSDGSGSSGSLVIVYKGRNRIISIDPVTGRLVENPN